MLEYRYSFGTELNLPEKYFFSKGFVLHKLAQLRMDWQYKYKYRKMINCRVHMIKRYAFN